MQERWDAKRLSILRQASEFFQARSKEGHVTCNKHRIEHSGKTCYTILIDLYLYRKTGKKEYLRLARERVKAVLKNITYDEKNNSWVVWPGLFRGENCSGNVIDCGAAVDCLCEYYEQVEDDLSSSIKHQVEKITDSYLCVAAVEKKITNQRLWGITGLAHAASTFDRDDWREKAITGLRRSAEEQKQDGAFYYHLYPEEFGISPAINDTTSYYHSRCGAFIAYAAQLLETDAFDEAVSKAQEWLLAITRPDGIKLLSVETKRWYWESSYEVASNAFDISLLTARQTSLTSYYAHQSLERIEEHMQKGLQASKEPAMNFQCRDFWTAHLAWLTRSTSPAQPERTEERVFCSETQVAKYANDQYCLIARGKKSQPDLLHGPPAGGSVLYFGTKENQWANQVQGEPWEGSLSIEPRIKRGELSISTHLSAAHSFAYHAWLYLWAGNLFAALKRFPLKYLRGALTLHSRTCLPHWACDADLEFTTDTITITGSFAHKDGVAQDECTTTIQLKNDHARITYTHPAGTTEVVLR